MPSESQIPIASSQGSRRFARRLALFYAAIFALFGCQLPFFPVWLRATGIDAAWIGLISAVPAVTRFTVLPILTSLAERHAAVRGAMIATAIVTAFGFAIVGTQHLPFAVFLAYAVTAVAWTPTLPLTDAYALRGVVRYRLDYGPMRLWGSAAFIVGALGCGWLVDLIEARHLIWIIAGVGALGAVASFGLKPLDGIKAHASAPQGSTALLRDRGFLGIIAASALIQSSHSTYYVFGSITWQAAGFGGLTIAALWTFGVIAEIVVFAISPRFTLQPSTLVMIGGIGAVARWLITAQEPPVAALVLVQLAHGMSYGLTQLGTMGLMVRHVPVPVITRAQGYLAACSGIVSSSASIVSGMLYARYGHGAYYAMAIMALSGVAVMRMASSFLKAQPHSAASGG
ncbi:MAG TPA: MFS transporter [Bradyrhizobium sp.]|uniref:MFS transporter n=1 Tax=Bradyrhizobium sp. TaxID=376 RepID=UPI002D7F19E5|nr:MFS transporter [Bradyrhizobium sp.]HET7884898.1 MFS transporter [Bradyrhizobium sp.]